MANRSHKGVVVKTGLAVVAMFAFGFALVPLYNVFCDITGLNGKVALAPAAQPTASIDRERLVTVELLASRNQYMPWEFEAQRNRVSLHPGEQVTVEYLARNLRDKPMVGRAVPSVTPGRAAKYLHKVECFCFQAQRFEAGESRRMPVVFYVDGALPEDIDTITLSYTFFDVTERAAAGDVAASDPG